MSISVNEATDCIATMPQRPSLLPTCCLQSCYSIEREVKVVLRPQSLDLMLGSLHTILTVQAHAGCMKV